MTEMQMVGEGVVLGGRYRLLRRIGQGGMAAVWAAHDETLQRDVACKILLPRHADNEQFRTRFAAEAHAAARLSHPNIVSVFDTGEGDLPWIVMELVDGGSLAEVITAGGLTEDRALEVAADVCLAMDYAHRNGLIHRDIKPGNVLLAEDGTVKVTDFGIARAITAETVTQTAAALGTAAYLSPEQAQGIGVDERTDIYSLGVTLYEVLTGTPPFEGDNAVTVAYQHVQELPTAPRDLRAEVSDAAEAIVLRAMAKNPNNRYQTAMAMRDDLLRARSGQSVSAPAVLRAADTIAMAPVSGSSASAATVAQHKRRRGAGYMSLALLSIAAAAAAFIFLASLFGEDPVQTLPVPDVVGETIPTAMQILREQGMVGILEEDGVFDDTIEAGRIVRQDPPEGTQVEDGAEIRLVQSLGPEEVVVPDVAGLTEDEAVSALVAAGLTPGQTRMESSDTIEEGVVIRSDPPANLSVRRGETVDLTVSSGQERVRVLPVENTAEFDARSTLQGQGLEVLVVREFSDLVDEGFVIRQDPAAGTEVRVGSEVTIVVSRGPQEPEPEPSDSGSPSPTPSDQPTIILPPGGGTDDDPPADPPIDDGPVPDPSSAEDTG